jgi:hypothetical protein
LNVLPGRVFLPQYNWLPETVVEKIAAISPPDVVLVGIDDRAVLIRNDQRWNVAGTGGVTMLENGRAIQEIESGRGVPDGLL